MTVENGCCTERTTGSLRNRPNVHACNLQRPGVASKSAPPRNVRTEARPDSNSLGKLEAHAFFACLSCFILTDALAHISRNTPTILGVMRHRQ